MSSSSMMTVFKNVAPAFVVMVAGLAGAYMVYDSYVGDNDAARYSAIAPASGDSIVTNGLIDETGTVETTTTTETTIVESAGTVAAEHAYTVEFAAADTNGDGKLSKEEALLANPKLGDHFDKIDADGDGFITIAEDKAMLSQTTTTETVTEVTTEATGATVTTTETVIEETAVTPENAVENAVDAAIDAASEAIE